MPARLRFIVALALSGLFVTAGAVAAQPYAYVLTQRDDPATPENRGIQSIVVFDAATNTRVTSVDAGLGCQCVMPDGIAIARDGSEVYAVNEVEQSVTIMATATNTVVTTLGSAIIGNDPAGIVVSPDNGRLYVLNGSGVTGVTVVDRASRTRVTKVPLGVVQARGIDVAPDGTRIYVSTYGSNSVKVIDAGSLTVIGTIPVASLPMGVAVSPGGQFVYTAAFLADAVSVASTVSGAVVATPTVGTRPRDVRVSPTGHRVYAVNGWNSTVSSIDPATHLVTGTISGVVAPASLDFTADGSKALVVGASSFVVVETATNTVQTTVPLPQADGQAAAIVTTPPPFTPPPNPPPTGLTVASVAGNLVTLRWTAPVGSTPNGYVVEGGVTPGQVLASLPTGTTETSYRFTAPSGAFHVRVHALTPAGRSPASNEVPLLVNVAAPPSAPVGLLGLVDGTRLSLAWQGTFGGGRPPDTGSTSVVTPRPRCRWVPARRSFAGVPAGTYTLTVRALNAAGVSDPSNAVSLTFPGACSARQEAPPAPSVRAAAAT